MIRRLSGYLVFSPIIVGLCVAALLVMSPVASANTYNTSNPIPWCIGICGSGDSGTLTGNFQLDSTGNPINWNLTTTDGTVTGSNYIPGDAANALGPEPPIVAGSSYTFFDDFSTGLNLGGSPLFNGGGLTIIVNCQGVANCLTQGTNGQYFSITGATETFVTWSCAVNGSNCTPSVAAPRTLDVSGGAYINVTDPPSTPLAFTLDTNPLGTAWTPGGGTGNNGVPEPSTLLLSALGLGALALKRFYA